MNQDPNEASEHTVTALLRRWSAGETAAGEQVMPLVYEELHRIAVSYFRRERAGHTLQPTAIVHEAFLRLEGQDLDWRSRAHFLGIASRLMRQILVDHARSRGRAKRGGDVEVVPLLEAPDLAAETPTGILALDEALRKLASQDEQKSSVVELRFFGGLTNDEIADFLGISKATVVRQWRRAKAFLYSELSGPIPT